MNAVLWVVGLISTGAAIYCFWQYRGQPSENAGFTWMMLSIVFAVLACACAGYYFFKKFREDADQDISITKF